MENVLISISYQTKTYKKNEIIKNVSEECNNIAFIISGSIKIYTYLIDGKETIIKNIESKNLFGNFLIYNKVKNYPGFITSVTNSKICYIKKDRFEYELQTNLKFLQWYLEYISLKATEMQNLIKIYSQNTLKEKIMSLIIYKCNLNGTNQFKYKSHNDLANMINIPRSSFSRTLYMLEKEKLIFHKNKIIFVNNIYK